MSAVPTKTSNPPARYPVSSFTSSYWIPGINYQTRTSLYPIERNLGFLWDIPLEQPVASPWYFGDGNQYIAGTRKLVFRPDPQLYPVGNYVPAINGQPMVSQYKFDRETFTQYI